MGNEYMVGDIVLYRRVVRFAPIVREEKVGKILETSQESLKVVDMDGIFLTEVMDENDIAGVSLSPAILKENGWINVAENVYISSQSSFVVRKEGLKDKGWINVAENVYLSPQSLFVVKKEEREWHACIGNSVIFTFCFVHQLQHLMYGLGLGLPSKTFRILPDEVNVEREPSSELSDIYELGEKEWCLVRDANCSAGDVWRLAQFAFAQRVDNNKLLYCTVGGLFWEECIPYNNKTKHLLGTREDLEE